MFSKHFLPVFLCLAISICAPVLVAGIDDIQCGRPAASGASEEFKVVNGDRVDSDTKWPWMAAFFRNDGACNCKDVNRKLAGNYCFCCTASVVGPHHLLLAAHCFEFKDKSTDEHRVLTDEEALAVSTLRLGSANYSSPNVLAPAIKQIRIHRGFTLDKLQYDIAIIELVDPLQYDAHIRPICLSSTFNESELQHQLGSIAGWGVQHESTYKPDGFGDKTLLSHGQADEDAELLREGTASLISVQECMEKLVSELVSERNICTAAGRQYSAKGDSGGPLFMNLPNETAADGNPIIKWTQVGVTSFSYPLMQFQEHRPVAYTRVSAFCDWIGNATSNAVQCN